MLPPALSRISEDSRTSHKKYVNIAGIEEYPNLVGKYKLMRALRVRFHLTFVKCPFKNEGCLFLERGTTDATKSIGHSYRVTSREAHLTPLTSKFRTENRLPKVTTLV